MTTGFRFCKFFTSFLTNALLTDVLFPKSRRAVLCDIPCRIKRCHIRGCEWGYPTSDKGRKILLTTDKIIKKLPTTDRKNITDYRHGLFVSRKKSILHFFLGRT